MKKGLLLSVVASGFIFAGGNIAPAAPVAAPAAAPAACDFYGSIAARYEANSNAAGKKLFNKKANKLFVGIDLGVEKQIGNGFGLGAEVAAIKGFSKVGEASPKETAELSQLYVTYKAGNTAFKAGRQALPKSLSPWAWTDSTANVKDNTFEGLVVVNTDVKDTVLVGAWIARAGSGATFKKVNGKDNKGLFAATAQYKGIANTTLTGSVYYVTKPVKATVAWASALTKAGSVDLGLQAVYGKASGSKATTAVAAFAKTNLNGVSAKLTGAYLKSGALTLAAGGTSAFWGNSFGAFGGDIDKVNSKQKIVRLDLGYALPYGKLDAGIAYDKNSGGSFDKKLGARVGYNFKVSNVNARVEYRYVKTTASTSTKKHRVRVQGVYKF